MKIALLLVLLVQAEPGLKTEFRELSKGDPKRAIVLLHGLTPHPFSEKKANAPVSPSWQEADSRIGKALSEHGSLHAFSYSQNVPVQEIPKALRPHVAGLRKSGFKEIVLVGFSAGALIVRQFVEDHPEAGVTRVIQVSPPNEGSDWGRIARMVRESQEVFVRSLKYDAREKFLSERAEKGVRIPPKIEFVVVMGTLVGRGDTTVTRKSQWPERLRKQGIPVYPVSVVHTYAMRSKACAMLLSKLVSTPQPRWSPKEVEVAEKEIFD